MTKRPRAGLTFSQQIKRVICIYACAFIGVLAGIIHIESMSRPAPPASVDNAWIISSTAVGVLAGLILARLAQVMTWFELLLSLFLALVLLAIAIPGVGRVREVARAGTIETACPSCMAQPSILGFADAPLLRYCSSGMQCV